MIKLELSDFPYKYNVLFVIWEEKSQTISLVRPNREYFINWWFNFSVSATNNNPLI
jgi:hypothetical protein